MIAMFLADPARARRAAARFFGDDVPLTDGPFRYLPGDVEGEELRLYIVEGNAQAAYAAARTATRRGATRLVPFLDVTALEGTADRLGFAPGDILPIQRVWDGAGLLPLMRLLPESASEFPIPAEPLLPASPSWETGSEGLGVATLPFSTKCPLLCRLLEEKLACPLVDLHAAGFAQGAADAGADLLPLAFVSALLTPLGRISATELEMEAHFEAALGEALKT